MNNNSIQLDNSFICTLTQQRKILLQNKQEHTHVQTTDGNLDSNKNTLSAIVPVIVEQYIYYNNNNNNNVNSNSFIEVINNRKHLRETKCGQ
jgi:hypothetical protein